MSIESVTECWIKHAFNKIHYWTQQILCYIMLMFQCMKHHGVIRVKLHLLSSQTGHVTSLYTCLYQPIHVKIRLEYQIAQVCFYLLGPRRVLACRAHYPSTEVKREDDNISCSGKGNTWVCWLSFQSWPPVVTFVWFFFLRSTQHPSPVLQNTWFVFRMKLVQPALFLLKQNLRFWCCFGSQWAECKAK